LDDLFYKDKEQVSDIVNKFSDAILYKKNTHDVFFTNYRIFKYKDELDKIRFDYNPQSPDDFIEEFSTYFENALNYDNPGVMYNVLPNPNIYGQIASLFASFANPNFCMDIPSGKLLILEKAVINYLIYLAGWECEQAGGIFTFGGKGTLLYALKIALDKIYPNYRKQGLNGDNYIISNDLGHPCHIEICNWVGIGEEHCVRLKTYDAVINVEEFKQAFVDIIKKGGKLPLIIINGMTTNNHTFDDVKAVYDARNEIVNKYGLDYTPHLHVDSVLGWVYLLINRYDFILNPLGLDDEVKTILRNKAKQAIMIKYADSFSADFHKTGFCNYVSSVFLIKEKNELFNIENHYSEKVDMVFSEYAPYDYSLESSRSPHGPVAAFAALKTIGVEGFVRILANHTEANLYLKDVFNKQENAVVCNFEEESNLLFLVFKPEKYWYTEINENTTDDIAEEIKEFNVGFYNFILDKCKNGKNDIYFSCSRSYKYYNKSYGCLKLYSFNSHLDKKVAIHLHKRINELLNEYMNSKKYISDYKFFDYAEVKGVKSV